eukprot:TRINITY_DN16878_c3_g1_i1.p1 TRINITY_DN16878_c3_g1~~TRINITY_DN16878_c3_g1_i1.p1  ORF type:complete len:108 (+),score=0.32 TRINITY_DN16878_c3_g1_i1:169-492(+)
MVNGYTCHCYWVVPTATRAKKWAVQFLYLFLFLWAPKSRFESLLNAFKRLRRAKVMDLDKFVKNHELLDVFTVLHMIFTSLGPCTPPSPSFFFFFYFSILGGPQNII